VADGGAVRVETFGELPGGGCRGWGEGVRPVSTGRLRIQERPNECLVGCLAVAAPWKDLDREAGILVHRPRSEHRAQSSPDPYRDPDDPAYHWHGGDRVKGEVKSHVDDRPYKCARIRGERERDLGKDAGDRVTLSR
jgi:hypothetical protein